MRLVLVACGLMVYFGDGFGCVWVMKGRSRYVCFLLLFCSSLFSSSFLYGLFCVWFSGSYGEIADDVCLFFFLLRLMLLLFFFLFPGFVF